jgi:hypothetical protein
MPICRNPGGDGFRTDSTVPSHTLGFWQIWQKCPKRGNSECVFPKCDSGPATVSEVCTQCALLTLFAGKFDKIRRRGIDSV